MVTPDEIREFCQRYDDGDNEGERLAAQVFSSLERRRRGSGKECSRCHTFKPLSAFSKDSSRKDGLYHRCKACDIERKFTRANSPNTDTLLQ